MPTSSVNTRDVNLAAIAAELEATWPELPWKQAQFGHGAFHGVITAADVVIRIALGASHAERTVAEAANTEAFGRLSLDFVVPRMLGVVVSTESWSAAAYSRVRGRTIEDTDWAVARHTYLPVLEQLRALPVQSAAARELRPVRTWCGGEAWAARAERCAAAFDDPDLRRIARDAIARVSEADGEAIPAVIHGDLNPFNLLVDGTATGLIDLDHAAVGDPAIDLAWLVLAYPISELRRDLDARELERARLHRRVGPLQIAASADAIGDTALVAHALGNFARRATRTAR